MEGRAAHAAIRRRARWGRLVARANTRSDHPCRISAKAERLPAASGCSWLMLGVGVRPKQQSAPRVLRWRPRSSHESAPRTPSLTRSLAARLLTLGRRRARIPRAAGKSASSPRCSWPKQSRSQAPARALPDYAPTGAHDGGVAALREQRQSRCDCRVGDKRGVCWTGVPSRVPIGPITGARRRRRRRLRR